MANRSALRTSPARLALAVKQLRADREDLDLIASDPIAIIGMGCRFPGGASSPEEFWTALKEGRDCKGEIPPGRWKDASALPPHLRRGGYLPEIAEFDAAYFGISPREAIHIDPQQRLLLEVTWEALWDAGIAPASLAGTNTGVFTAIYNTDYNKLQCQNRENLTAHSVSGTAHSVATGRVSFLLDIRGPSVAIDSACSSSLVATHLACQSLRAHECEIAIAGGSSLKSSSDEVVVYSQWGMLASDARCKTFDADADGFVSGEGSGVVILKRLSDALRDGDRVRAVIRGTAVNHDGKTTVLTAPNGLAHEALFRDALHNAMLEPGDVSYIETHGTGTSLGDPIEVEAIGAVYGQAGSDSLPCVLGAVKTNLGHLEAAAGLAGLIKTVLCMEHGEIPRNLHFHRLNPEIFLDGTRLTIPTENVPWPRGAQPRVAGISSFGVGGTNGHVIVEEAPQLPARSPEKGGRAIPLPAYRWQRQRFWLPEPRSVQESGKIGSVTLALAGDAVHPLLGRRVESPFIEGAVFEGDLSTVSTPYLAEHRLGDRPLVPFAAFLETASAATRMVTHGPTTIRNFVMREPGFVTADSRRVQVLCGNGSVEIASQSGDGWTRHAKGSFETTRTENGGKAVLDNAGRSALRARCDREISPDDIYGSLERSGLRYGSSFRTIQSAWAGRGESLAHLRLREGLREEAHSYGLHPALLDGCLQTIIASFGAMEGDLFLPISLDEFELRETGRTELWVHTRMRDTGGETLSADLTVADADGNVVARLTGFTVKRTTLQAMNRLHSQTRRDSALSYEIAWRPSPLPATSAPTMVSNRRSGERWLLIERREGNCGALAGSLAAEGAVCEVIRDREFRGASVRNNAWSGIVYDAREADVRGGDGWHHPEKPAVEFVLEFVKYLAASGGAVAGLSRISRLWVVSSSSAAVLPSEDVSIAQAPLTGLLRTLSLEYPEVAPVLIDVDVESDTLPLAAGIDSAAMLVDELAAGGEEALVAFRCGKRYVARMVHPAQRETSAERLQFDASGRLEDLRIEPAVRTAPEPHQVEIKVRAAGLNFRDVLTALGMLPARLSTPGGECAGTIVRVGENVRDLKVGENVLAFALGGLQTFVNVDAKLVAHKPAAMTFADAAGIPVAFLTAHYGLDRLARLSAGQSVLIHAATGGLGLAAVQLAMRAGATVFATAGSPEKREFLQRLGVEHVFSSRSLAFREQVLEATAGAGVNVVLNSLAGEFIGAGFDVTAQGGCFLEVGKRDIWSAEQVAALGKDIRYFPFDLGEVAMKQPDLIAGMLGELMGGFSSGELRPLPTSLYAFEDATQAFRTMAQARHIGKIVLGIGGTETRRTVGDLVVGDLVSSGTVLITGGLGALGIETARWLAAQGARNIVLTGRTASPNEKQHPVVVELRAQGVDVTVERADVAVAGQLQTILRKIRASGPPLRAVFHAAGIVQDAVLAKESWNSYRAVTSPKIEGAWNLHRLTEEDPVELMVFFSSVASVLGSPGQGSYAAGNAFLDALAHHRASRGLRTLSVNWGAWASAGMAARLSPEQAARWERLGVKAMEASDALGALQLAIESGHAQVAVADVEWERFLSDRQARPDRMFYSELRSRGVNQQRQVESEGEAGDESGILVHLRTALSADRKAVLAAHVKVCARRVLGLDPTAAIDDRTPLQDVGLDSLMALEMRNELAQSLGLTLGAGLMFDYPSVEQVSQHVLGLLAASMPAAVSRPTLPNLPAAAVEDLSDEEAERLLIEELEAGEKEKSHV